MKPDANPTLRALGWMAIGSFLLAASGQFVHGLRDDFAWDVLVLTRGIIAVIVAGAIAAAGRVPVVVWGWALWLRSIFGTLLVVGMYYSFQAISPADTLTYTNTRPIWVALIAWLFSARRLGWEFWIAILCAVCGAVLIEGIHSQRDGRVALIAVAAGLAGAAGYVALGRIKHVDARMVVLHLSVVLTVGGLVAVLVSGHPIPWTKMLDGKNAALLLGAGLAGTLYQYIVTHAVKLGGAPVAAEAALMSVALAYLMDLVLWDEPFAGLKVFGMFLILAPTAWMAAQGRAKGGGSAVLSPASQKRGEATPPPPASTKRG